MQIHVKIEGLDKVLEKLAVLDTGLQDHAPFLQEAGGVIVGSSQRNFVAGGRPKWAPLSWSTVIMRVSSKQGTKKKNGFFTKKGVEYLLGGAQPLTDTGYLKGSIGNPAQGGIYRLEKNSITIGTALKKAKPLHDGATTRGFISGRRIPPRPFMTPQAEDKKKIYDMAVVFVQKKIDEAKK